MTFLLRPNYLYTCSTREAFFNGYSDCKRSNARPPLSTENASPLETISLFYSLRLFFRDVPRNTVEATNAYGIDNCVDGVVPTVGNAYSALTRSSASSNAAAFCNIMTVILSYISHDLTNATFTVLEQ